MAEDDHLASVPGVQRAFAEGDTIEEAIFNCIDVVKLIMVYRAERGESLRFGERNPICMFDSEFISTGM